MIVNKPTTNNRLSHRTYPQLIGISDTITKVRIQNSVIKTFFYDIYQAHTLSSYFIGTYNVKGSKYFGKLFCINNPIN